MRPWIFWRRWIGILSRRSLRRRRWGINRLSLRERGKRWERCWIDGPRRWGRHRREQVHKWPSGIYTNERSRRKSCVFKRLKVGPPLKRIRGQQLFLLSFILLVQLSSHVYPLSAPFILTHGLRPRV